MITTSRFLLRPLKVSDVSERYLSWLSDGVVQSFIITAHDNENIEQLRNYVAQRANRRDVLFLGIFTHSGEHIGNIKYEPIDPQSGSAVMGILIGETSWRGVGVSGEVITASALWLRDNYRIDSIVLGVDRNNIQAIRAYRKIGFNEQVHPLVPVNSAEAISMVWEL